MTCQNTSKYVQILFKKWERAQVKEFLGPQALKSSMGMGKGKDVLRRFRRNIGSL